MSNFAQFVFTLPKAGKDIVLELSLGWDTLKTNQRTITQPELRRTLKIMETPPRVIVPITDQEEYAAILSLGEKSAAHIERFDEMARTAKEDKIAREALKAMREFLNS